MKKLLFGLLAIVFLCTLTFSGCGEKAPDIITVTVDSVGSALNNRMVAISQAVEEVSDMKMRLEPVNTQVDRYAPLVSGEAELTLESAGSAVPIYLEGLTGVGLIELRWAWFGAPAKFAAFARGDAGFKTISDLRGKRVPTTAANKPFSTKLEAVWAFGGLTLNDVEVIDCSSVGTAQTGVLEGNLDASFAHNFSGRAMELASSRHGIYQFELPHDDVEGWKRMRAIAPWFVPVKTAVAGSPPDRIIESFGEDEGLLTTPKTSEDVIYAVCEAMKAGYDLYKDMEPELANWTWEKAIEVPVLEFPYHTGTVKFLKDQGAWTAEHEAFQQNALAMEKERMGN